MLVPIAFIAAFSWLVKATSTTDQSTKNMSIPITVSYNEIDRTRIPKEAIPSLKMLEVASLVTNEHEHDELLKKTIKIALKNHALDIALASGVRVINEHEKTNQLKIILNAAIYCGAHDLAIKTVANIPSEFERTKAAKELINIFEK